MKSSKQPYYASSTLLSVKENRSPHTTRCRYCQNRFHFFLHLFECGRREHWMVLKFKLKRCLRVVNPSDKHTGKRYENNLCICYLSNSLQYFSITLYPWCLKSNNLSSTISFWWDRNFDLAYPVSFSEQWIIKQKFNRRHSTLNIWNTFHWANTSFVHSHLFFTYYFRGKRCDGFDLHLDLEFVVSSDTHQTFTHCLLRIQP